MIQCDLHGMKWLSVPICYIQRVTLQVNYVLCINVIRCDVIYFWSTAIWKYFNLTCNAYLTVMCTPLLSLSILRRKTNNSESNIETRGLNSYVFMKDIEEMVNLAIRCLCLSAQQICEESSVGVDTPHAVPYTLNINFMK